MKPRQEINREYYLKNKERLKRTRRPNGPRVLLSEEEKAKRKKEQQKKWHEANGWRYYNDHLKRSYGITLLERNEMALKQNNRCLICDKETPKLVVDHCHTTGKIRGLLCKRCNTAIGMLGDTPEGLQRAIDYLNAPVQHSFVQPLQDQHEPHPTP